MLSSCLRPPGAGLAGMVKTELLSGLVLVSRGSLGMASADRFPVADLSGVSDPLASVKEAVAAFEPAAVTSMDAVEAVLGDRGGVGDDPGDGGELLHGQSPYRGLANDPSPLPVHGEVGTSAWR